MKNPDDSRAIDERLLRILACPVCVADATVKAAALELAEGKLLCPRCGRRYAVVDGIPNMIPEEAESAEDAPPADK
jgi:hypothetical protein